ncbi:MAG TPA: flagellar basal body P-ring protein FlgI [Firmicutes bacterium]|nr:flagellar basal body P-ring protein FlgI [Bacillota bacterium]
MDRSGRRKRSDDDPVRGWAAARGKAGARGARPALAAGLAAILVVLLAAAGPAAAESSSGPMVRVKDVARIVNDRPNQLTGLGLVVGLEGTGDSAGTMANVQMVANALSRYGVTVSASQLRVKNVAAVMATAELPAFARTGDRVDVTVSSFGDAKSLQGGVLLLTPLRGVDGQVYAVAQGPVSIGGFNASAGGSRIQKNHPTVGLVPGGALVEREVPNALATDLLTLVLHQPDFTTAARLAQAINRAFTPETARAVDKGTVTVTVPVAYEARPVEFLAALSELEVQPDTVAKVVVNERTGTIVMGENVTISPVAVAHGSLSIRITAGAEVSQPPPFSPGRTVVAPQTEITADQPPARFTTLGGAGATSVADLVKALNALGATPRDVVAILQAIKEAGALHGELEII